MAKEKSCPRVDIGGQAVLDGVMMKAPDAVAVAVRRPNGDIVVKREAYVSPAKKHKWMGWPFIRGAVSMVSMLGMGMRVLTESAKMVGDEAYQEEPGKFEKWLTEKLGDKKAEKFFMGLAVVMALALSVGLFMLLPNAVRFLFPDEGSNGMEVLKNLISGVVRILLLIAYISFCGRVPEMKKTFQYHGAEHKTVYCNENGLELNPQNAQQFSTLHPRCGTAFLLLTFFLSIIFYSVFDVAAEALIGEPLDNHFLLFIAIRILLLPLLTGISYEVLKALAHSDGPIVRALRWPGLQMQRLTTKQPTDEMIEVAIVSMNAALHGLPEGEKTDEGWVVLKKE